MPSSRCAPIAVAAATGFSAASATRIEKAYSQTRAGMPRLPASGAFTLVTSSGLKRNAQAAAVRRSAPSIQGRSPSAIASTSPTSRAEYRLLLRQDNADLRLRRMGYEIGLVSETEYRQTEEKRAAIEKEIHRLEQTSIGESEALRNILSENDSTPLKSGITLAELIRRPELSYEKIAAVDPGRLPLPDAVKEQVDIQIKYEGYIKRQMKQVEQFKKLERKKIPEDIDYEQVGSLRLEAIQKLTMQRPVSIGQASRISGVSPADISVLLVYLEKYGSCAGDRSDGK